LYLEASNKRAKKSLGTHFKSGNMTHCLSTCSSELSLMQLKNRKNLMLPCAGVLTLTTKFQDTEGNEVLLSILEDM
jgi:hypothetical protein